MYKYFLLALMILLSCKSSTSLGQAVNLEKRAEAENVNLGFSRGMLYRHWGFSIGKPDSTYSQHYKDYYENYTKGVLFYDKHLRDNTNYQDIFSKDISDANITDDHFSSTSKDKLLLNIVTKVVAMIPHS